MKIGPDLTLSSRIKTITLMIYSYRGGDVTVSVDKPGLTPRTPTFTSAIDTKTAVVFDIHDNDQTYTITATDVEGSDTCTVGINAQCSTGADLSTVEADIIAAIEGIVPSTHPDIKYTFQVKLLDNIDQVASEPRRFNFPLQNVGTGPVMGSRFGEYYLQVVYPDGPDGSDLDDIMEALESYQYTAGIMSVRSNDGNVQYEENLKTSILSLRIYALYNAVNE